MLFRVVSYRLKALFTAHAALELEAELLIHHIERKAALLRQAAQLEAEGMNDLAAELRKHASKMDAQRPAEGLLPALSSPAGETTPTDPSSLIAPGGETSNRKKQRGQAS
jgi:hypothetical protein